MSRYPLVVGLTALVFAAGPAFAQSTPAQGTVQPHHVMHPAAAHKMSKATKVNPDLSADQLNAKELASLQGASSATTMPAAKKTP